MPRKVVRRRRFKKKGRKVIRRKNGNRVPSAFLPTAMVTKLKYTERVLVTSTLGNQAVYIFRGNSLFDPNYSGTGTQPIGFPTLAALYHNYRVLGSKCTVTVVNQVASAGQSAFEMSLQAITDGYSTAPDPETMAANPDSRFKIVGANGGGGKGVLSMYRSTSKVEGVPAATVRADESYSALVSTNPAQPWFWQLGVQSIDHTSTTTFVAYFSLTYYCRMESRRPFNVGS